MDTGYFHHTIPWVGVQGIWPDGGRAKKLEYTCTVTSYFNFMLLISYSDQGQAGFWECKFETGWL